MAIQLNSVKLNRVQRYTLSRSRPLACCSQFVVVGGSSRRMQAFAGYLLTALDISLPAGQALDNIAASSDRFALYKVGPVLAASVSHTPEAGFTKPLRLTKAGFSDWCIQTMHALVRKSSFSKAQGLRETGSCSEDVSFTL